LHALAVGGFQVSKVLLYVLDVLSPIHYFTVSIIFFQLVFIPEGDIFRLDKLLIPINIESLHWFLAVVFMQEKKVVIYDSLPVEDGREDYLTDILQYLKDEHKHKHGLDLPNVDNWTTVPCPKGNAIAPLQGPTNDCGVFLCLFMDLILLNCPAMVLSQDSIQEYGRAWLCASILKRDILF